MIPRSTASSEKAEGHEPFFLREHEAAGIDRGGVYVAGFDRQDTGVGIRAHGDANNIFRGNAAALHEHSDHPVLGVAGAADGNFLALEVRSAFDARISDQIKSNFLRLKIDAFQRRALERGAHATAAGAAKIDVAAEQSRDRQWTGDDYGFVFEPFVFKESFSVRDVNGKIIQVGLRDGRADFFGASYSRPQ